MRARSVSQFQSVQVNNSCREGGPHSGRHPAVGDGATAQRAGASRLQRRHGQRQRERRVALLGLLTFLVQAVHDEPAVHSNREREDGQEVDGDRDVVGQEHEREESELVGGVEQLDREPRQQQQRLPLSRSPDEEDDGQRPQQHEHQVEPHQRQHQVRISVQKRLRGLRVTEAVVVVLVRVREHVHVHVLVAAKAGVSQAQAGVGQQIVDPRR